MKKLIAPIISIIIIIIAAVLLWEMPNSAIKETDAGIAKSSMTSTGNASIGGQFSLVDMNGFDVTEATYKGSYSLVFFGFTSCPDICPTTLQVITQALEDSGDISKKITPIFITVDPERDTPDVMKEYISNFHPDIIALTGTKEQTAKAAKAYKVYAQKSAEDEMGHYLMDHSGFIYLMDRQGNFVTHFTHEDTPETLLIAFKKYVL